MFKEEKMERSKSIRNKKIVVANKIRLAIFISILLIIISPVILLAIDKPAIDKDQSFMKIYVEPGDTLWGIAQVNLPPKTDIRQFIHRIKVINQLDTSFIKVGDLILVPEHP